MHPIKEIAISKDDTVTVAFRNTVQNGQAIDIDRIFDKLSDDRFVKMVRKIPA